MVEPAEITIDFPVPANVSFVVTHLQNSGFEAYLVGGCVRDLFMNRTPKDWDIVTSATPEEIITVFEPLNSERANVSRETLTDTETPVSRETISVIPVQMGIQEVSGDTLGFHQSLPSSVDEGDRVIKTVYTNIFGTVSVIFENEPLNSTVRTIEVTPYRIEGGYSDNRRPDEIRFTRNLDEDLSRRDFTMNALVYDISKRHLTDMFGGINDILKRQIVSIGHVTDRFTEDALRILRACRFVAQLGFTCTAEVEKAIAEQGYLLQNVSRERIRDEFIKIIESPDPSAGIMFLVKHNLMQYIIPELLEGVGCEQKGAHIYDVFDHLTHALQHASDKGYTFHVKLAALFHDIGKPRTRRWDGSKANGAGKFTFYGHEVVGARMAQKIMENLKFPRRDIEIVEKLVRYHMFFSDTELITLSAVRRIIQNVGEELIWELMRVRECDRVGMKKAEAPYRLRKYFAMIEEALRDPISPKMLVINGETLMAEFHMKPGRRMGWILHALLEEVIDDPTKNIREYMDRRVGELDALPDNELRMLGEQGKQARETADAEEIQQLHMKHRVG